ncbi:MAG: bifunctional DNA-formamidopyrimidine glycosylase/DNA-(apurinic or apyrimidinic site) lyase [Calditrichaeota bacterium]|nr:MAG: bifunctional DNA-formamidopyrimidine glycosylase/DNA-(apurinic or apyrimidinic site) lyase [Calditrichota bacterium]
MPELPEVETLCQSLKPHVLNRRILAVQVFETRLRKAVAEADLQQWVTHQTIKSLERRAKYLLWRLSNEATVVFHLGMSGRLGVFFDSSSREKHTHVVFQLENCQVHFRDPRKFGLIDVIPPHQLARYAGFEKLGIEPLSPDFSAAAITKSVGKSKKPIKLWIMDAQNVVGVGNIYANEVLFDARIHPLRPAFTLSETETSQLVMSIKHVLKTAVNRGGTTLNDFRDAEGEPGFFQMDLQVYQKTGQLCGVCGAEIQKSLLSGRSTFYCPNCQV